MINRKYRESALKIYGEYCEICNHRTSLEVHHIDYQEHQQIEDMLRYLYKYNGMSFSKTMEEAKLMGYLEFKNNQLAKNDSTLNLSVLCGNCHSLIHKIDVGKKILRVLNSRKEDAYVNS